MSIPAVCPARNITGSTAVTPERTAENLYHVLVCDDDEAYRHATVRMLNLFTLTAERSSFRTFQAASAEEALGIISCNQVDCVLLDYLMPGSSGLSSMETMLERHPGLCIILVTGAGNESLAVEAMKKGAMDYLVKDGITIERLERALISAICKSEMQRTINQQQQALIQAERQRVMLQSLAAACHHIAQPVTVLRTYIVMLKRTEQSPEARQMLVESFKAIETLVDILWRLQHVSEYRTEKYIDTELTYRDAINNEILRLPELNSTKKEAINEDIASG